MEWKKTNEQEIFTLHDTVMPYLSVNLLEDTGLVRSGISLRQRADGSPVKVYWREGEKLEDIEAANDVFLPQFGTDRAHIVMPHQEHTAAVRPVTEADLGACLDRSAIPATDGLVTNVPGAALLIYTADCGPLFFLDPVKRAIGLSHSGRKGTLQAIGRVTVETMVREYGSRPEDILCAIGPCICGSCYEVGDEILPEVLEAFGEERAAKVMARQGDRYHLNLWEANRLLLLDAGLRPEHIAVTNICTRCNVHALYSYRGDGRIVNQIAHLLMLKPEA